MSNPERHIGICGTFDVENYGDLLFPLIAETELLQRLGPVKLHRFSYQAKALPDWPYNVSSLTDLSAVAGNLDGMIIGGGDLIRFDKDVAPGYYPPAGIHHPTGYWLTPMLIALQHRCPVVWNAPGVYGEIPAWAEPLLELVIPLSSYLSVRDDASRQTLNRFAGSTEIELVPDTVFAVAQLINIEQPSSEYTRLCESINLKGPYIIVQATTGLEAFSRLVQKYPQIFQDYQLLILPIGPVLGDDVAIVGDNLPGSIRLPIWPNPLLLTELIGQADAIAGTSLHLAIAALAFGVPVFRPGRTFSGKYAIIQDFDMVFTFDNKSDIDPDWFKTNLGRKQPSPAVLAATSQLSRHWDRIASIFTTETKSANLEILGHFWQSIPGLLETWETRLITAFAQRDIISAERDRLTVERNTLSSERDQLIIERDGLVSEWNTINTERDALYNSKSWKITAPLRALARSLRRQSKNNGG